MNQYYIYRPLRNGGHVKNINPTGETMANLPWAVNTRSSSRSERALSELHVLVRDRLGRNHDRVRDVQFKPRRWTLRQTASFVVVVSFLSWAAIFAIAALCFRAMATL